MSWLTFDPWSWARWIFQGPIWLAYLSGAAFYAFWAWAGEILRCWLYRFICSLAKHGAGHVVNILLPVLEALPEPPEPIDVGPMVQVYLTMDHYLPLTEAFALLTPLAIFVIGWRMFRLVKSLIPMWSN